MAKSKAVCSGSLKTKARTTENPRRRKVLVTKVFDLEHFDVWSTVITPLDGGPENL